LEKVNTKVNIVTTTLNYLYCGLSEFLENLYDKNKPKYPFHHTIIDQGSTDGTLQYLNNYKSVYHYDIVSFNENKGVSWAHNYVWRNYPGEHYVKLDPDVIIENTEWLSTMVKIAEEHPKLVGNIGINFENHWREIKLSGITVENKIEGNIGGACLFIPNYVNKEIGYWDVLSEPYGEEDALMGMRVHLANKMCLYLTNIESHLINKETKEYREFKDSCRKRNVYDGNSDFQRLQKGYCNGTIPLYVK
jgi:glycosyltransferase involved in cell wall biosynthesis